MQLYSSSISPFARKCRIVAEHLGLTQNIEIVKSMAHPIERNQSIIEKNPLGQIPALVLDDGSVIHDSRVICEYLNDLGNGSIFPKDDSRWLVLTQQSLADGITDSAILVRYEQAIRPETFCWNDWITGQMDKINKGLDEFERAVDDPVKSLHNRFDIGTISLICALDYVTLRLADFDWKTSRPKLAKWHSLFSEHASVKPTAPKL